MSSKTIKFALFLNYGLFAILLNSVGTVILQVQLTYGVSESSASVLEGFKDLSIAACSFFAASIVWRLGLKKSLLVSLILVGIACLAMPTIPQFWMNKMMFAVTGVSFALVKVSTWSTLGLITNNEKEHISLMSFIESFFMIGIFSSYFLFGAFVDDHNPQSTGWLNVYWVLAFGILICFVSLMLTKFDESEIEASEEKNQLLEMVQLCAKPLILLSILSLFLYVLIEQSVMSWLPTFNSSVLNMSPSLSIQMASILAMSVALGRFFAGVVLKWLDWFPVIVVCLLLSALLVIVALPMAQGAGQTQITSWFDAPLAAYIFPLLGVFLAPIYPSIVSVILSALPKSQHASMSGLILIFGALGGTTGSIITGTLFEKLGGTNAFYFSLVPIGMILISLLIFKRLTTGLKKVDEISA